MAISAADVIASISQEGVDWKSEKSVWPHMQKLVAVRKANGENWYVTLEVFMNGIEELVLRGMARQDADNVTRMIPYAEWASKDP